MDTVLIGVCTYRRPQMLAACLAALAAQQRPPGLRLRVVVVDNDVREGVTSETMLGMERWLAVLAAAGIEADCLREPRRGIPHARNAVLAHAAAVAADYIAFVDDDAVPSTGWIAGLYALARQEGADVVWGRVIHERAHDPWLELWYPLEPNTRRTGDVMDRATTGNVLFRGDIARQFRFHDGMPLGLGEDLDFFRRVIEAGARCLYHREAVVREVAPPERNSRAWHVQRRIDLVTSETYWAILRDGWAYTVRRNAYRALRQTLVGSIVTAAYPLSRRRGIRGLWRLSWGLGALRGLLRIRSRHYRIPTGR